MYIEKIILNNFKIYYGINELSFEKVRGKNISVVTGNNGYGKTTLLTSLVWCLYGKLIIDIDDKYRKEVYDLGGYKKFACLNLNRQASREDIKEYSVEIILTDLFIPSIPCNKISVKRIFNINSKEDVLQILIDDTPNELTKEVGPEIFINDFLLPKEIAKFFFFDAEKIVSLAENKTLDDKKMLSKAYSEVLGIKKYEDLKTNLENVRIRLRRNNVSTDDRKKLNDLNSDIKKIIEHIDFLNIQIESLKEEKELKRKSSESLQEKLIREGNSLSQDEIIDLREKKKKLLQTSEILKHKIKELLDLAPFAISGNLLAATKGQLLKEINSKKSRIDSNNIIQYIESTKPEIIKLLKANNIHFKKAGAITVEIFEVIKNNLKNSTNNKNSKIKVLHDFNDKEYNEFEAIYNNLKNSYTLSFRQITKEFKDNKIHLTSVIKKLSDAESKEGDLLIQEIRKQKDVIDNQIEDIDLNLFRLNQEIGKFQNEFANKSKIVSEIDKRLNVEEKDKEKDLAAKRMIEKLEIFLLKLKNEKKRSLEQRILKELNILMHKENFISKVSVEINESLIDIHLIDNHDQVIHKDTLSKGEQQLYATALLKALVDESNFKFPVFIDSPLQKFDKKHSKNIICEFYPNISEQVIIFPLLNKELTIDEFEILKKKIQSCYIIASNSQDSSQFIKVNPEELFSKNEKELHVY